MNGIGTFIEHSQTQYVRAKAAGRHNFVCAEKTAAVYGCRRPMNRVLDKNGRIIGIAGAGKDITKQIEAEQGLRLLSKVFEDSLDPIVLTDLSGNIINLNEATIEAYGYSRQELLGEHIGIFAPKEAQLQACRRL